MKQSTDDFTGISLSPNIAVSIIRRLFEQRKQWSRAELIENVQREHKEVGGVDGAQRPDKIVKQALTRMKGFGEVYNVAFGMWRKCDLVAPQEPYHGELVPERIIGEGDESVYLYYFPSSRELAQHKEASAWPCKIGRTSGDVSARIFDQGVRTAFHEKPIVGLVIRTDGSEEIERALHISLRMSDNEALDSLGSEWFITNPSLIEVWHEAFLKTVSLLKITS